jgi:hypothetical protein
MSTVGHSEGCSWKGVGMAGKGRVVWPHRAAESKGIKLGDKINVL